MTLSQLMPAVCSDTLNYKAHFSKIPNDPYESLYDFEVGKFKDGQEDQTVKNFERKYILSFVYYNTDEWLFVGIYESFGAQKVEETKRYKYDTKLLDLYSEYIGRVVVKYKKEFRNSYPKLETCIDDLEVLEIKRETHRLTFPGYDKVNISWEDLKSVIDTDSWKTALENQKGVYLITDTSNGKRYVGSARGEDMLWGRWKDYLSTGHGGNKELKTISFEHIQNNFRYSILEIFKSTTNDELIIRRESWWKEVLLTRDEKYGYNGN